MNWKLPCVIFDLEFTAWPGSNERLWSRSWESTELVEIGALKVSETLETKSFTCLAKPKAHRFLSHYFKELTGISQAELDAEGLEARDAFRAFYRFCNNGSLPVYSWGGDERILKVNYEMQGIAWPQWPGGFFDMRDLLVPIKAELAQYNSGSLARKLGLEVSRKEHRALSDVESIFLAARELLIETDRN